MVKHGSMPTPAISVIIVVLGGRSYIPRCLDALTRQAGVENLEILVPCDDRIANLSALQEQFPGMRFLHVEGQHTYAELRAFAVRQARGAVVALTEDHCIPDPHWCDRILAAHESAHAAVGGVVDKKEPDTALNWALYLADYVRYSRPISAGPSRHLTDCNVSYKRSALQLIGGVWQDEFHEPIVHGALQDRGESLWLSPEIIVRQQRSVRLGDAILDRYLFGRLFAGTRPAAATWLKRLFHAGFTILLPFLLMGRVAGHVFRKRRYIGAFARALPLLTLLSAVWAWGEFVGYLTGRPGAALAPGARPAGVIDEGSVV